MNNQRFSCPQKLCSGDLVTLTYHAINFVGNNLYEFPNGTCSRDLISLGQSVGMCIGNNGRCGVYNASNINDGGMGPCLNSTLTVPNMHPPVLIRVGTLALNGTKYFDYSIELLAICKQHAISQYCVG